MRPDELSALAAIDLRENDVQEWRIAVRRPCEIDEVFRDAVCRLQDFLSQAKVTFSRSGWRPQGVPNSKRGNVNGAETQEVRGLHRLLAAARIAVVTPMRAKIMKITYTDSRDGMVLIGFTDERGEHEIALSTIETADLIGALRTSLEEAVGSPAANSMGLSGQSDIGQRRDTGRGVT